jgi:hypothetical protein
MFSAIYIRAFRTPTIGIGFKNIGVPWCIQKNACTIYARYSTLQKYFTALISRPVSAYFSAQKYITLI